MSAMTELRERVRNALVTNIALQGKRQNILLQVEADTGLLDVQQMLDARELADAAISAVMQDLEAPTSALETLQAENERLREQNGALALQADEWEGKYAVVSEFNARLRKALHFYADTHPVPSEGPWGAASMDFGDIARAALGAKP